MKAYWWLLVLLIPLTLSAQVEATLNFHKHIINFSDKNYGKDFNAQNWAIAQDKEGIMYFGNSYNVLTYDGLRWNSIPMTSKADYVVSLHHDTTGDLFWGANGDFGIIKTASNGKQTTISFLDKIAESDRYFTIVWKIMRHKNQIVFFTQECIFLYNSTNGSIKTLFPSESFHLAFEVENQLFVRDRSYGLMKFDGKIFQKIKDGDIFKNEGIFGIIPLKNGKYMIITQQIGLFTYDLTNPNQPIVPMHSAANHTLNNQQIIGSIKLSDGNIALNTASNGVIIINQKGEILHTINLASGISDNDVKQVFQDKNGNLWLATNNGISLINYTSPISIYQNNETTGFYGSINCLLKFNNTLYIGTSTGLYSFSENRSNSFQKIPNLTKNITSLVQANDFLIVGTSDGVYSYKNNSIKKIAQIEALAMVLSNANQRLYIIGNNGLAILNAQNPFSLIYHAKTLNIKAINAINFPQAGGIDQLWIGTLGGGLYNVTIYNPMKIKTEVYGEADGVGNSWVKPFNLNNQIFAGNSAGFLKYISTEEIKKQLKDSIDNQFLKAYFVLANIPSLDSGVVSFIEKYNRVNWLVYNGIIGYLGADNRINQSPFLSLDLGKINAILPESENMIWVGGNEGLARVDLTTKKNYRQKPDILIREMKLKNDSIIFYKTPNSATYQLDYTHNTFNISFSSTYIENGVKPLFSYKLVNFDDQWSPWSEESVASFKKLREGKYIFKVKSKNVYNIESSLSEIIIIIAPPWYRTLWAYLLYFAVGFFILVLTLKIYTFRLKQKNIALEKIIDERTAEIRQQKNEIETQRDLIAAAHSEITSSIQYAKRIQTAVLPTKEFEHPLIKDYFILFRPKDVVSGDFYWAKQNQESLVVATADCTGHGVPGAFMSMLGISLLNEIVGKEKITNAATILNKLRDGVVSALKQKGGTDDQKDGMDISLISIDLATNNINWAGAYNPLFILSKTKPEFDSEKSVKAYEFEDSEFILYEIKADRMPIGISDRMTAFEAHNFKLHKGDRVYMFSDGFIDQFGGENGKKFMIGNFRNILMQSAHLDLNNQKKNLEEKFEKWLSFINTDTKLTYHQIDDVCVIGLGF